MHNSKNSNKNMINSLADKSVFIQILTIWENCLRPAAKAK